MQQNHDGLPQKAGYPQASLNEIHGSWYDPANPVVPMNGCLRSDLFDKLLHYEQHGDLTVSMGTSMCGMTADRIFTSVAARSRRGMAIGGVIIGLQCTQYDHMSCLRIFAKVDDVMQLVLNELGLFVVSHVPRLLGDSARACQLQPHVFQLPYTPAGTLLRSSITTTHTSSSYVAEEKCVLDLRPGAVVMLTGGPFGGDQGEVLGCTPQGHYRIRFRHGHVMDAKEYVSRNVDKEKEVVKYVERLLGIWWLEAAAAGAVPCIPVVNPPVT